MKDKYTKTIATIVSKKPSAKQQLIAANIKLLIEQRKPEHAGEQESSRLPFQRARETPSGFLPTSSGNLRNARSPNKDPEMSSLVLRVRLRSVAQSVL